MKVDIVLDEDDLKRLILEKLREDTGLGTKLTLQDISIQTKSRQNYKSEWKGGAGFKATVSKHFA